MPKPKARQKAAKQIKEDFTPVEVSEALYQGLNTALPFINVADIPVTPKEQKDDRLIKVPKEPISKEKAKEIWNKVFQESFYMNKDNKNLRQFKGIDDQVREASDDLFKEDFLEETDFDDYDVRQRAKLAAREFEPSLKTLYKETVSNSVRPFMVRPGESPKNTSYEGLERARVRAALGYRADNPDDYAEYMKSRKEARARRYPGDEPLTGPLEIRNEPKKRSWFSRRRYTDAQLGAMNPQENTIYMRPEAFKVSTPEEVLSHEIAHSLTIPKDKRFQEMKSISEERKIKLPEGSTALERQAAAYLNEPAERIVRVPRIVKQALTALYGTAPKNKKEAKAMISTAPSSWWDMVQEMVLEESKTGNDIIDNKLLNDIQLLRRGNNELLDELLTVTKANTNKETA